MRRRWPPSASSRPPTRWAAASPRTAAWRSRGCDALELAREFGTPAYVVDEDDIRARARAFVGAFARARRRLRGALRGQGVPVHGDPARAGRGGARLRRRLGRRAAPRAARGLRARAHPSARQRQVARRPAGRPRRRRRPRRARQRARHRPPRGARRAGRAPDGADADRARGSARTRTRRCRRAARTRSSASTSRRRRARSRAWPRRAASSSRACTCTSARRSSTSRRSARRSRPSRRSATSTTINLGGGLGVAYGEGDRAAVDRGLRRLQGRRGPRAARRPAAGSSTSRAARSWPTRRVTLYSVESRQAQRRHLRRRRRRHVGQPAPDALRRALRGRGRRPLRRRHALPPRRQALRVGRRHRARRRARRPAPGRRDRDAGDRRLRLLDGQHLQRASRAPPVVFVRDGDARLVVRRDTPDDLVARDV